MPSQTSVGTFSIGIFFVAVRANHVCAEEKKMTKRL